MCFHSAPASIGVASVRESQCWITYSLLEERHAWLSNMIFENHVAGSMESTFGIVLVGDVVS